MRDFGNGRFCRSLVESAIRRKSVRLGVMDADDLSAYLDPARYSDEALFSLDGNCFTYSAAGEDRSRTSDRLFGVTGRQKPEPPGQFAPAAPVFMRPDRSAAGCSGRRTRSAFSPPGTPHASRGRRAQPR